jgi:glycosyltransferase involved in cell wall biosynthesis
MAWQPLISVVIPTRKNERIEPTLDTLMRQGVQDLEFHIVVDHDGRGQGWARNRGAEIARGTYLLFSDNDIEWQPNAVSWLLQALKGGQHSEPSTEWQTMYAYGKYRFKGVPSFVRHRSSDPLPGAIMCDQEWDWFTLRQNNYISTMCLVERHAFVEVGGFDEALRRLEDWDLWLRFGFHHYRGVWVDKIVFQTSPRAGVSYEHALTHEKAMEIVMKKHGLPVA